MSPRFNDLKEMACGGARPAAHPFEDGRIPALQPASGSLPAHQTES